MANVTPVVLVISRDTEIKNVCDTLQSDGFTARAVSTTRELQRALATGKGRTVAVFDADMSADPSQPLTEYLDKLRSVPLLVLMPAEGESRMIADPERTSPEEYVRKPIPESVLALRIKALVLTAGMTLPTPTAPQETQQGPLALPEDMRGQLTVVFSVKGGAGKSTIATHVAAGLASMYSLQTLLVDANLWFGDVGVLLNLTSSRSSFDVSSADEPDIFALPKAVVPHPSSGASVLLRPPDPLSVEKIRLRTFLDAIERYRSMYEHVIVDGTTSLDELTLDLLDKATRILLVVTPEMGALHNTARFLGLADRLALRDKIKLVLNRSNSGIGSDELQRTLGISVSCGVVSAGRLMLEAVNEGSTLFALDPTRRERITQDLAAIVELVAGRAQPPVERTQPKISRFGGFLRRSA